MNTKTGKIAGGLIGGTVGVLGGAAVGFVAGAAIGTVVPVIGNIIGAVVGGVVGAILGGAILGTAGYKIGGRIGRNNVNKRKEKEDVVQSSKKSSDENSKLLASVNVTVREFKPNQQPLDQKIVNSSSFYDQNSSLIRDQRKSSREQRKLSPEQRQKMEQKQQMLLDVAQLVKTAARNKGSRNAKVMVNPSILNQKEAHLKSLSLPIIYLVARLSKEYDMDTEAILKELVDLQSELYEENKEIGLSFDKDKADNIRFFKTLFGMDKGNSSSDDLDLTKFENIESSDIKNRVISSLTFKPASAALKEYVAAEKSDAKGKIHSLIKDYLNKNIPQDSSQRQYRTG